MESTVIRVRDATLFDQQRLATLIHFERYVHRHLDWKSALEWVGSPPYLIAERGNELVAALGCPPDPPEVAWVRFFVAKSSISLDDAWRILWNEARRQLDEMGVQRACSLSMHNWFNDLLLRQSCTHTQDVVVLLWNGQFPQQPPPERYIHIRQMELDDLLPVTEVDNLAFELEWRNSTEALGLAFNIASLATVAELDGRIAGYQISTATPMGGHLARLAVHPDCQGHGVGTALVNTLLETFVERGVRRVTVNTQSDNQISLSIYHKSGFVPTGEAYPVFRLPFA